MPLSQLSVDPDRSSTLKWHEQDEMEPSEHCVQPQIEPSIPQFSLPVLQLENKASVIVLESEPILSGSYQMVFEGCFENNVEEQMVSRISGDGGHRLWLQGPFNLLTRERKANYVAAILLRIMEFLSV